MNAVLKLQKFNGNNKMKTIKRCKTKLNYVIDVVYNFFGFVSVKNILISEPIFKKKSLQIS